MTTGFGFFRISKLVLIQVILFAMIRILVSCANTGMPEGGKKDETPPSVVSYEPKLYAINCKEKRIRITFDEYIQLKDANRQLVVSPPVAEKPEVKIKGKTLVVDLNGEFLDSTTYTLNFGDAILDNNEGNVLKNFRYIFSTGNIIDSLKASGNLKNAYSGKSETDALVMLYTENKDSIPLQKIPVYLSRTDANGNFSISNIRKGTYKIFALKDANANFLFDQADENIAFSDSTINVSVDIKIISDTVKAKDSLSHDTVIVRRKSTFFPSDIQLKMFQETPKKQFLKKTERTANNKLGFIFNLPVKDTFSVRKINHSSNWYQQEYNKTSDTITCWLTDTSDINNKNLVLLATYFKTDSTGKNILANDTVRMNFIPKKEKSQKKSKVEKEKYELFSSTQKAKTLVPGKNLMLTVMSPASIVDSSKIHLYQIEGTQTIQQKYSLIHDKVSIRNYTLTANWKENTKYRLSILSNAFYSYKGTSNDSTAFDFACGKTEDFGNVSVKIQNVKYPVILQLLNEKETVINETFLTEEKPFSFTNLEAKTYKLRLILDKNSNGKWDTGNYLLKIQPEEIVYYKEDVKVRANWDVAIEWNFAKK